MIAEEIKTTFEKKSELVQTWADALLSSSQHMGESDSQLGRLTEISGVLLLLAWLLVTGLKMLVLRRTNIYLVNPSPSPGETDKFQVMSIQKVCSACSRSEICQFSRGTPAPQVCRAKPALYSLHPKTERDRVDSWPLVFPIPTPRWSRRTKMTPVNLGTRKFKTKICGLLQEEMRTSLAWLLSIREQWMLA